MCSESGGAVHRWILSLLDASVARAGKKIEDVGTKLDGAVKSYNESIGSLESRVLPQVRRMKEMAFPDKDELPTPKPIDKTPRL